MDKFVRNCPHCKCEIEMDFDAVSHDLYILPIKLKNKAVSVNKPEVVEVKVNKPRCVVCGESFQGPMDMPFCHRHVDEGARC